MGLLLSFVPNWPNQIHVWQKQLDTEAKGGEELKRTQATSVPALVNLTNNLSISSDPKVVL